jgi:hypothetical protein
VHAIAAYGPLAHGEEGDAGRVDLLVVTYRPGGGPQPAARRVAGIPVLVDAVGADDHLAAARTLTAAWPLLADRYLTTRALFDPDGYQERLRDTHLGILADSTDLDFAALARDAWGRARAALTTAYRLLEWHDTDGALLVLGEARVGAALVDGLLGRTYFRDRADALRRTGLGGAGVREVERRLDGQVDELVGRGVPVDAVPAELAG